MTNDEIIELAASMVMDEMLDDKSNHFDEVFDRLNSLERRLVQMEWTLLERKRFSVCATAPENLQRYRSLADAMGATIRAPDERSPFGTVLFFELGSNA
jgi:hypothetical protein